ncbi:MAG TPA: hypothetical protein VK968_17305 [Roseimicrobium sp.]|nr:hypothetical protein [Roseimicrobium sp.]
MSRYNPADFTFVALDSPRAPSGISDSLGYIVGIVDPADQTIADPVVARQILAYLYSIEGRIQSDSGYLLRLQKSYCAQFFSGRYFPMTPCMITKGWSPVATLLEKGFEPELLNREIRIQACASGIWKPASLGSLDGLGNGDDVESLFWGVLEKISKAAEDMHFHVSVIARPGWVYEREIGSLPTWSKAEVEKSGRVVWKRTPEG